MILDKKHQPKKTAIEIDLTGPEGNAFYLLGLAQKLSYQIGYTKDEWHKLEEDMTSSDYEHLLCTFDDHFSKFVILYK